jgi:protease I
MKNSLIFGVTIIVIIVSVVLIAGIFVHKSPPEIKTNSNDSNKIKETTMEEKSLPVKKAVLIVAFRDFRDEEYFIPKKILEEAGIEVKTASNKMGQAIGSGGGDTEVDLLVENLNPADFDAVVFSGGSGCLQNLDNESSYKVIRETVSQDRILAAICISPVILAKAGVLQGKKATVWSSALDKSPIKILKDNKAIYEIKSVVRDGKIITANGPSAAQEFGAAILEALAK